MCIRDRPYTVYYNFNEKLQKAEVPFLFLRLASKPGFLTIDAVQDSSASSCLVNFTALGSPREDLKLQVHDLPSVEVNKGDYIVEDLHEGEQTELIFRFFGVPPFTVTYVRTTELNDKKLKKKAEARKIIETHTIDNIMEYEYTVLASLEAVSYTHLDVYKRQTYNKVEFLLTTHDVGHRVTNMDIELAEAIRKEFHPFDKEVDKPAFEK